MKGLKNVALSGFVMLTALGSASAQSGDFTVSGTVKSGGQPLEGAFISYVKLEKRLSWAYSGANGAFGPASSAIINKPNANFDGVDVLNDGPVTIDVFDVRGHKVSVFSTVLEKGRYSIEPVSEKLAKATYLLKISAGNSVVYRTYINTGKSISAGFIANQSQTGNNNFLAKKMAALDTVRIGKTGYMPIKVAILSYTDNIGEQTLVKLDLEKKVDSLYDKMGSQNERYGQIIQAIAEKNPGVVASAMMGSNFGGGSNGPLGKGGSGSAQDWASLSDQLQAQTRNTPNKIPLLNEWDVVHGFGKCNDATVYPHNIGLGATWDTIIVEKCYRVGGIESRGCGVHMGYGPCNAVVRDDRWGRTYEGFSETPEISAAMSKASVLGYQTSDLSHPTALAACAKHFAGDGGADGGTNTGNMTGDDAKLRALHLPGYAAAVKVGVASIMASYGGWNGVRMHQNKALLTDWLKTELKWDGYINGDWDGDIQHGAQRVPSMNAGLDVPMRAVDFSDDEANKLRSDFASADQNRIKDAIKRVLRLKFKMNLFAESQLKTDPALIAIVGSKPHRDVAREAVRKSLVLLKTKPNLFPISKTAKVTLVGEHAQKVGLICGGWTLGWQGDANATPNGSTSIQKGFETIGGASNITYSGDGNNIAGDIAVVCIGEQPYAETMGDKGNLEIPGADLVSNAKKSGKPVVCVMVTGRPMDVSAVVDNCDALVEAWLPGTEGSGVAEVFYGINGYDFTGKLPMCIPMNTNQEPVNVGDGKTPRFAYGFGLNSKGETLKAGFNQYK